MTDKERMALILALVAPDMADAISTIATLMMNKTPADGFRLVCSAMGYLAHSGGHDGEYREQLQQAADHSLKMAMEKT